MCSAGFTEEVATPAAPLIILYLGPKNGSEYTSFSVVTSLSSVKTKPVVSWPSELLPFNFIVQDFVSKASLNLSLFATNT